VEKTHRGQKLEYDYKWPRSYPPEKEVAAIAELADFGECLKHKKNSIPLDAFEFPLEDIVDSLLDEKLQKKHRGDDPQSKYGGNLQDLERESVWFYLESPAETWRNLCGQAGWMVALRKQLRQLAVFCEATTRLAAGSLDGKLTFACRPEAARCPFLDFPRSSKSSSSFSFRRSLTVAPSLNRLQKNCC
jgi:hypothetical protein